MAISALFLYFEDRKIPGSRSIWAAGGHCRTGSGAPWSSDYLDLFSCICLPGGAQWYSFVFFESALSTLRTSVYSYSAPYRGLVADLAPDPWTPLASFRPVTTQLQYLASPVCAATRPGGSWLPGRPGCCSCPERFGRRPCASARRFWAGAFWGGCGCWEEW